MFINMEFEIGLVSMQYNCITLIKSKLDHKIITSFGLVFSILLVYVNLGLNTLFP